MSRSPALKQPGMRPEDVRQAKSGCNGLQCAAAAEILGNEHGSVYRWSPPLPLAEIDAGCIEAAARLQRALRPSLERRPPKWIGTVGEFEQAGLADYQRELGHRISDRHFRRLICRTLERDGGAEDFARVELFLDEHPKRRAGTGAVFSSAAQSDFRELHELIASFRTPAEPSAHEEALLWLRAIELFNALVESGRNVKRLKNSLLAFLWKHAPRLAKTPLALRRNFDRKVARWIETEGKANALMDGRKLRKGTSTAPPYASDDLDKIVWHAVANCGSRYHQAVRELVASEGLSPDVLQHFYTSKSKSYMPGRLREAVRYDVAMLKPHQQGPRAADKVKASLTRDYAGIYSNTAFMADDFTMPVLWYVPDGRGWFSLVRGQVLIVIDFRSLRILGYSLQADAHYNSAVIRTLFTRVFEERGLPRVLYLERGIWKTSKLITGGPRAERLVRESDLPLSWAECEMGLRQFGLKFVHARRARSKTVERVGGLVQDLMEREPGYVGREERYDKPERTTAREREVNARKVHPSKHFYDEDQWCARLSEIFDQYNATQQQGRILAGVSPDEAYEQFQNPEDPPTKLGPECRFLLAHHRIPVTVTNEGICFRVRGQQYKFRDAQTGRYIGRKMLAWFNVELPDIVTVTTEDMTNPFTVERHQAVPALDPDPDLYAREVAKVEGHAAYAKTRYRVLRAKFAQKFRANIVAPSTVELGRQMERQQLALQGRRIDAARRASTIARKAADVGIPASVVNREDPDAVEYLEMMREAERQHREESQQKGGEQ